MTRCDRQECSEVMLDYFRGIQLLENTLPWSQLSFCAVVKPLGKDRSLVSADRRHRPPPMWVSGGRRPTPARPPDDHRPGRQGARARSGCGSTVTRRTRDGPPSSGSRKPDFCRLNRAHSGFNFFFTTQEALGRQGDATSPF